MEVDEGKWSFLPSKVIDYHSEVCDTGMVSFVTQENQA